jgi:hypothetical protein
MIILYLVDMTFQCEYVIFLLMDEMVFLRLQRNRVKRMLKDKECQEKLP